MCICYIFVSFIAYAYCMYILNHILYVIRLVPYSIGRPSATTTSPPVTSGRRMSRRRSRKRAAPVTSEVRTSPAVLEERVVAAEDGFQQVFPVLLIITTAVLAALAVVEEGIGVVVTLVLQQEVEGRITEPLRVSQESLLRLHRPPSIPLPVYPSR